MAGHVVDSSKLLGTSCVCSVLVRGIGQVRNYLNSFLRVSSISARCACQVAANWTCHSRLQTLAYLCVDANLGLWRQPFPLRKIRVTYAQIVQ